MKAILSVAILASLFLLSACDRTRISEYNSDLPRRVWNEDSLVNFDFDFGGREMPVNMYLNLRNSVDYPWRNIYVGFWLKDSADNVLITNTDDVGKLKYFELFDPKTGFPKGDGLGDIFEHQFLIIENYLLPGPGRYTISFQQFMRKKDLEGIVSVGYRLEKAGQD